MLSPNSFGPLFPDFVTLATAKAFSKFIKTKLMKKKNRIKTLYAIILFGPQR